MAMLMVVVKRLAVEVAGEPLHRMAKTVVVVPGMELLEAMTVEVLMAKRLAIEVVPLEMSLVVPVMVALELMLVVVLTAVPRRSRGHGRQGGETKYRNRCNCQEDSTHDDLLQ